MTVPEPIAELWLRHEAGLPLSDEEQTLLVSALAHDESWRKSLLDDSAFDAELRSVSQLESSEDVFATEFSRRLAIASHVEVPPVEQVPVAVWIAPPSVQAASPINFIAPAPVVPPAVVTGVARPAARRARPDLTLAVACSVCELAGAIVVCATLWLNRPDESHPVAKNTETSPANDHTRPWKPPQQQRIDSPAPEERISLVPSAVVESSGSSPKPLSPSHPLTTVPIWKVGGPRSDRLPAGRHELRDGLVAVRLDNDREIELAAPAVLDVGADDTLTLLRGTLRTTKVAPDMGLTLSTPTSRVFDRGGRFEVAVDDAGATNVVVAEGRVACRPGAATDKPCKLLELSDDTLNRLKVFNRIAAPGNTVTATAVTSVATGRDNQFLGQVAVNGETVEFSSPQEFEEFRKRAMGQFEHAPEQFLKQWSELLKSLEHLNGTQPAGTSSFQGVININGKETRFNSREEYEAALKNFLP